MARYPSNSYGRRRNRMRNQIYIILAVLVVGVIAAVVIGSRPFGRSVGEAATMSGVSSGENAVGPSIVAGPKPAPNPSAGPAPELKLGPTASPEPVVGTGPSPPKLAPKPAPVVEPEVAKVPTEPGAGGNPQVGELIAKAMALLSESPGKTIEVRDRLNDLLSMPMSVRQREFVKGQLSRLAEAWVFSRSVFPGDRLCGTYRVESGDNLTLIGGRFKVPHQILQQINNISRPEALAAGQSLKVINGPFNCKVYRSGFTMDLYLQNTYVRSFRVGLGKPGRETPTGLWCVEPGGKLEKPQWTDPDTHRTYKPTDPDYPLGSRWIALKGLEGDAVGRTGIAFHGVKDPDLMSGGGSRGCIRLYNGDVVLLYNLLVPSFSKVRVVE